MPHLNISENLIQSSDRVALFLTIISIIIGLKRTHYIQNMFMNGVDQSCYMLGLEYVLIYGLEIESQKFPISILV